MVKKLGIALLALFMLGCSTINNISTGNGQDIPDQVVEWSQTNVWKVITFLGRGSGFWINSNHFITACHVVRGYDTVLIEDVTEKTILYAAVTNCDAEKDLALLTISETEGFTPLPTDFVPGMLPVGRQVYGAGYPLGNKMIITSGHAQKYIPQSRAQVITSHTIFGDSGSPALRYFRGRVSVAGVRVRIASVPSGFSSVPLPNMALMVPSPTVTRYLRGFESK